MLKTEAMSAEDLARHASDACACFQARQLARQITRAYDEAMRDTGLKATQFTVLAAVVTCGEGVCLSDLADNLGMERSTFSRNLMPLVKRGLVEHSDALKGRSRAVVATPEGRRVFAKSAAAWRHAQDRLYGHLDSGGEADFLKRLRTVNTLLKS